MAYNRPNVTDGVTRANKPFFDNIFDGIDDRITKRDADSSYAPRGEGGVAQFARQDARVVTNFEPGHGFTIQSPGGGTSNLNDTSEFAFGTQSLRVTTGGTGASAIVQASGLNPIPDDRMYRIWVKVAAPDTLGRIRILLSDSAAFTGYYTLESAFSSTGIPEVQRPYKAGEWVPIALPWATAVATGAPDRSALTFMRILINDRNVAATVRLGRIETVPDPVPIFPGGVVTLTYDDSFSSHYTVARPHLDKHGFSGVLFPILDRIGQPGYLTEAQVDSLAFTSGWEIGAHATTYARHVQSVTGMTPEERVAEFRALRSWQQRRGYASTSFAYPNGMVNADAEQDLRKFYGAGRLALGRFSAAGADEMQNPSLPRRMYGQNCGNLTVAQIQAEIDRAIANETWLILVFHDLPATKGIANDFSVADHQAIVDYIAASGISVATIDQVREAGLAYRP